MEENLKSIVTLLTGAHKTVATMESCTGGALVSAITNIEGASEILKFSAVTYSNEYKIKLGISPKIIETYSVYSIETAQEMSKKISEYASSDYGIGITGKLNRVDPHNPYGQNNIVFVSIYDKKKDTCFTASLEASKASRKENKDEIVALISAWFNQLLLSE